MKPLRTGSTPTTMMIGMVEVARCAATITGLLETRIRSTGNATSSAASAGSASSERAQRNADSMSRPSISPCSRKAWSCAWMKAVAFSGAPMPRRPMRQGLPRG
jgi:hypothetical protein